MYAPELTAEGFLPVGRFPSTIDSLEGAFVDAERFTESSTRGPIFEDFLGAIDIISAFGEGLIESLWVGGSFVTDKLDPDDIDCLFVLNQEAFDAISSNGKRTKLRKFNKKNYMRETTGLRVESFLMVRLPFAQPWLSGGVHPDVQTYTQLRGAWDDWWLRTRTGETADEPPRIESAHPRRGYLEVTL
ncbi:hypothetical protein C5E07_09810 [Pseudoclavibacter sp. RFBJ3]|uniref:DUF6932 family protein n=1 Tax=unclassified Pseudoclavibacter TaxID=2615177 RepID=UPI000CE7DDCF|nr:MULTISPECIES: hypothetical protein [unclassified Pseudoclavibacter]PPF83779.1 hypothetical protein C5C12_08890 [Pseudoclavibacter sp. RFBJ5]PPF92059.1 hypothetical protein C5E07_09810 [Pseudoclavibacter sp. RFBJ3]PPF96922.1 hypothetical protein C5C19_13120 [Pseudoclavibacter sp. RFBH5]PPG23609.1 hypothetical protein C5E13_08505 [Pseudoclavibacter sp. RFBI4]